MKLFGTKMSAVSKMAAILRKKVATSDLNKNLYKDILWDGELRRDEKMSKKFKMAATSCKN